MKVPSEKEKLFTTSLRAVTGEKRKKKEKLSVLNSSLEFSTQDTSPAGEPWTRCDSLKKLSSFLIFSMDVLLHPSASTIVEISSRNGSIYEEYVARLNMTFVKSL